MKRIVKLLPPEFRKLFLIFLGVCLVCGKSYASAGGGGEVVPGWAREVVWYQIFPERFRNGDAANDPTRDSLEWPVRPSMSWTVREWGGDWYAMSEWEDAISGTSKKGAELAFYQGVLDRRYGGDLRGVLEKLDYLKELGVTGLYFNPVFYARSLHKYDGNSFHHVDPYFGPKPQEDFALMDTETADPATWQWTAADKLFLELVKEAHARGMRVIIDGVFNHSGRDFFAFVDVRKRGAASPYAGWYKVDAFDNPETARNEFVYRGWWGHKTLPVFAATEDGNDMAMGPKNYIYNATRRWMDPDGDGDPSDGVDGWRLDVADERPAKFWADWNAYVRWINPEAFTSAEVWSNPLELIESGKFSSSMNYYGFAYPITGFLIDQNVSASQFGSMLDERRHQLPEHIAQAMQNMVDSHDTDRLASMIVNGHNHGDPDHIDFNNANNPRASDTYQIRKPNAEERAVQRLVALFQMTYVGAPMIYYGTEAGMWGGGDPDCRKPMIWADLEYRPEATDPRGRKREPDTVAFDKALFEFYQAAIALRRQNPVLASGHFRTLGAYDEQKTFVFERSNEQDVMVVALNRSDRPQTVQVELGEATAARLVKPRILLASQPAPVDASLSGSTLTLTLPAYCGVALAPQASPAIPAEPEKN